ncbi:hypothetical protein [Nioella sp.]|uniref:hypothetical protein n=1 Tax=Nioella sp. TaxID=1912091 RepID=UPI003B527C60
MTIIPAAGRLVAAALTLTLMTGAGVAQMHGHGAGHGMRHHGQDGTGHDEVNMPGLRGLNATPGESADLMVMFHHFDTLYREVENLPNGIRTVTGATDPYVMEALVRHVTQMIARVEAGDDPQIFIQSPTLDIFFARYDGLMSNIEVTEAGIVVTQTSDDPELVAALQTHAAEVSDMAARGMQAVHERMMGGG